LRFKRSFHKLAWLALAWFAVTIASFGIVDLAFTTLGNALYSAATGPPSIIQMPLRLLYMVISFRVFYIPALVAVQGSLQGAVLSRWFDRALIWLPLTALGMIVGWALAYGLGNGLLVIRALLGFPIDQPTQYFGVLAWGIASSVAGVFIGLAQFLAIRTLSPISVLWIPGTSTLWGLGFAVLRSDTWMRQFSDWTTQSGVLAEGGDWYLAVEVLYRLSVALGEGVIIGAGSTLLLVLILMARKTASNAQSAAA